MKKFFLIAILLIGISMTGCGPEASGQLDGQPADQTAQVTEQPVQPIEAQASQPEEQPAESNDTGRVDNIVSIKPSGPNTFMLTMVDGEDYISWSVTLGNESDDIAIFKFDMPTGSKAYLEDCHVGRLVFHCPPEFKSRML